MLIVLAGVLVIGVGLLVVGAVALPFLADRSASAQVASLGLDAVTCDQVATYAEQISASGQAQDAGRLVSMTDPSLVQDNRSTVRVPAAGEDPAFVLSCTGTGTKPDGTTAPVTANLYVDSTTQQLVAYAWDN